MTKLLYQKLKSTLQRTAVSADNLSEETVGTLAIAHHVSRLLVPIEIRPHIRAALATGRAGETVLDIRQPNVISPLVCHDGDRVAAAIVGAVHEQATHAHVAHLAEGDQVREQVSRASSPEG